MALETPSRPPLPMANAILNFHFDFLKPSLISIMAMLYCAGFGSNEEILKKILRKLKRQALLM